MSPDQTIDILLAEDNPGDVRLTQEAFKRGKIKTNLHIVANGEVALEFLRKQGKYADAVRPHLILLDLNMPRMDGRAFLEQLKKDPRLDCIPVIVFSSSSADEDIVKSYKLHASCYISKPIDLEDFSHAVHSIESFWLQLAKLPKDCAIC
jgi:chemotaxis family two-component system response regulator Rcp1